MAASCMMRQSDEKHILGTATTEILLWSSRRDLIAVSNSSGEVFLRRLSWSKVWKLAKKGDGTKVTSIVWRPDSEILAVGYSSGDVVLVNVETGETIHSFNPGGEAVTSLSWENNHLNLKEETHEDILPKLLPLASKSHNNRSETYSTEESCKMKQETELSLLWIGLNNGTVHGYAFGLFPCCTFRLTELTQGNETIGAVRHICPNFDHSQLTLLADLDSRTGMLLVNVETPLVAHCLKELHTLGKLYRQISGLVDYLTVAQKSLHEAWEDALVDLESKMARYETREGEISLSVDLMELLMFGHAGMKLEKFLISELTDKGLKRIGQAFELSYNNMQKLLVKNIQCANYHLCHYLTQLCGLAKQEDRFGALGLSVHSCLSAFRAVGSFTAKTAELLQVIEGSLKYLKTFFRWLYVTILRLSDETIAPELASSTQQDVRFIANFLAKDFETDGQVRLDRVGQYLRNEPLSLIAESKNRPWDLLVEAFPAINSQSVIEETDLFQPRPETSLVQEFQQLETRIKASFEAIPSAVGQSAVLPFNIGISLDCAHVKLDKIPVTSRFLSDSKEMCTILALVDGTVPAKGFYLFDFSEKKSKNQPRGAYFYFGRSDHLPATEYQIADLQFYNGDILSVLLRGGDESDSVFLQLSVALIREELLPVTSRKGLISSDDFFVPTVLNRQNLHSVDASVYIEPGTFRLFHDFQATSFGLSSSRKVAAIFSAPKRKIRIFDMEVDEDDLEEEDVTDQPSDVSQSFVGSVREDKENRTELSDDTDMAISP